MFPFHNPELDAANVLEVDLDAGELQRLKPHLEMYRQSADFQVLHPP